MIKVINDIGQNIIGFELSGVVTGEDYEQKLIPAIKKKLQSTNKVRVFYHLTKEFDSYEFKAIFDDAKAGLEFFSNWEKIAVVCDVEWIINSVKIFSFTVPGKVRTFHNMEVEEAKKWLLENEELNPNIKITLDSNSKIAILEPIESLSKDDFLYAKSLINPFIEQNGKLNGIIIYTKHFSGWDSFGGFLTHLEFIKEHHRKIKKLAFVTDSFVGEMGEKVGSHFVSAEIKNFDYNALQKAKEWIVSVD